VDLYFICTSPPCSGDYIERNIMDKNELPKVKYKLIGKDGNAFPIMGRFEGAAGKAGWPKEAIDEVLKEAMSSDYDHLLAIIMEHCDPDFI
jgi:hypothetical protein